MWYRRATSVWARAAACLLHQPPGAPVRSVGDGAAGAGVRSEVGALAGSGSVGGAAAVAGRGAGNADSGRWLRAPPSVALLPWLLAAGGCAGGYVALADASPPQSAGPEQQLKEEKRKETLVVLGTGWGGISFIKGLDTSLYDVYIISPRNYFVFTPLLPSVTTGTVEARSITEPIRRLVYKKQKEVTFLESECVKIDAENKAVICEDTTDIKIKGKDHFALAYDHLVIAVGAEANTFGTPGVKEYCHFLKEIEDAEKIHQDIVDCFESACLPGLAKEDKEKLLHFVIVGGGPTGVEFAAELHDLIHEDLVRYYPEVKEFVKITLVQSGDHILNTFDERISNFAEGKFRRDGVDVKTACRVLAVSETDFKFVEKATGEIRSVPYGLVVWSTGIGTRPVIADFMEQIGQHDRRALATDEWLRVKGCQGAFAIGDCATVEHRKIAEDISVLFGLADTDGDGFLDLNEFREVVNKIRSRYPQIDVYLKRQHLKSIVDLLDGAVEDRKEDSVKLDIAAFKKALCHADSQMRALPATAQVAAQQGDYLANVFNHMGKVGAAPEGPMRIRGSGRHRFQPFQYRHLGQFAPLGGEQAAAELPGDWVSIGRSTQWLWYSVYLSKQVSWRTKCLVLFDWTKRCIFGRDSSRV